MRAFQLMLVVLASLCVGMSSATIIFQDDFSSCAASDNEWHTNSNDVQKTCGSGAMTLSNTSSTYAGIVYHTFSPKPDTFTVSATIKRSADSISGGFYLNMSMASGTVKGYTVQIGRAPWVYVYKYDGSSPVQILSIQNSFITATSNELKVSRRGSTFNIFCNGKFAGTFTDASLPSGDFAFLVPPKGTFVVDNVVFTNEFTQGGEASCFTDDFNDGTLTGWSSFGDPAKVEEKNGALHITTDPGKNVYVHTNISLQDFVSRVIVSHRGGSKDELYGLFVMGQTDSQIPLAGFAINGKSQYGAFVAGRSVTLTGSTRIRGDAYIDSETGDTTFYRDTLEVIKRAGTQVCIFVVNGDTLTRFSDINFSITGIGVFCSGSLQVVYDDFIVAKGTSLACPAEPSSVVRIGPARTGSPFGNSGYIFNGLGQVIGSAYTQPQKNRLVPGFYLMPSRQTRLIVK